MPRAKHAADIHSRHTVLVVDDSTETRHAMVSLLEVKGFDVVGASSGKVALYLFQAGFRPCVVMLDVRMPEMDGWTVWERMKTHPELARIPVVILSADKHDHARARTVGIHEFLRKPINRRSLVATADRHCDRKSSAAA
jgi:CheY-like chemotaxis protein